jgi:hypothetical protein
MLDAVPPAILSALPSAALADLLDAMWQLAERSKSAAIAAAIDDGALWDARAGRLREIA